MGLRPLLLGPPLNERDSDPTLTTLDSHLEAVAELLPKVYGDSKQASRRRCSSSDSWRWSRTMTACCKRAALLFALGKEKELGTFFSEQERLVGTWTANRPLPRT